MSLTETMIKSGFNPAFSIPPSFYIRATFQAPHLPFQATDTLENDFEPSPGLIHLSRMLAISSLVIVKPAFRYYTSLTQGGLVAFAKTERWEGTCSAVPKGTSTAAAAPASTGSGRGASGARRNPPRAVASRVSAARGNSVTRRGRGRSRGGGQRGGGGGGGRDRGDHSGSESNSNDAFQLVRNGVAGSPPPPPPPSSSSSDNDMDDRDDMPYLDSLINYLLLFGFMYGVLNVMGTHAILENLVKVIFCSPYVQLPRMVVSEFLRGPSKAQRPVHIVRHAALFFGLALDLLIRSASNIIGNMKPALNSVYTVLVNGWFVIRKYLTQTAMLAIIGTVMLWYNMMDVVGVVHLGPAVRTVERLPVQAVHEEQLLEVMGEGGVTEEPFQGVPFSKEEAMEEAEVAKELLAEDGNGIYASMHCPIPNTDNSPTLVKLHTELPTNITVEHQNGVPVTQVEARSGYRVRRARVRKRKNVGVGVNVGLASIPADVAVAVPVVVVVRREGVGN